jgi:hypothetical protein
MDETVPRTRSRLRATKKFITQFCFAALAVTGLWFAGVGFSRTILSRPLGGDENGSNGGHFISFSGKPFKVPKGLHPHPGRTYIRGIDGAGPNLFRTNRGDPTFDWQSWMSAVHIIALIVVIALGLALIDRRLRVARRHRASN